MKMIKEFVTQVVADNMEEKSSVNNTMTVGHIGFLEILNQRQQQEQIATDLASRVVKEIVIQQIKDELEHRRITLVNLLLQSLSKAKIRLRVKRYISEKSDYLMDIVKTTVLSKSSLHINAPVGTGKTTFIVDIINYYKRLGYNVLLAEPQKSITDQTRPSIEGNVFVLNSDTKDDLDEFNYEYSDEPKVYLSTFDSAWRVFEGGNDMSKLIVIIDETHTILTEGRENFDKSLIAINESECPVLGFTASLSKWVLKDILNSSINITIEATELPPKQLLLLRYKYILYVIAMFLQKKKFKKTIIWVESIKDQEKLKEEILRLNPNLNVCVLNAETREGECKQVWDYLMKSEKILPGIDVLIINKVAQAGVNILDEDIDAVIFAGKFDYYGIDQYLGRTRNYNSEHYLFLRHFSKDDKEYEIPNTTAIRRVISQSNEVLDNTHYTTLNLAKKSSPSQYKMFFGFNVLNYCVVASSYYKSTSKKLPSDRMIDLLIEENPNVKVVNTHAQLSYLPMDEVNKSYENKKYVIKKKELIKKLSGSGSPAKYVSRLYDHLFEIDRYNDAIQLVNDAVTDARTAKKLNRIHIPRTRKAKVIKVINLAKKANISIHMLVYAAKVYVSSNNDVAKMKKVLNMNKTAFSRIKSVKSFYSKHTSNNTRTLSNILSSMSEHINEKHTADEWRQIINGYISNGAFISEKLADDIYKYCLITKQVQVRIDGKKVKRINLVKIISSEQEYYRENDIQTDL